MLQRSPCRADRDLSLGVAPGALGLRLAGDGLDFATVGWETYDLAASRFLNAPVLDRLIAAIRERAGHRSGYRAARS